MKSSKKRLPLLMILLVCINVIVNAQLQEAKKAIAESNARYFESFVKNDSSIFINSYAEDACILAPDAPAACGREAFARFFRLAYQEYGLRNGKFITTNVYGDGKEYVTEEGYWQSFNAKGELFDDGKFLVLWKKTASGWKMFRDSFSSNHAVK
ncbi:MULTISPECIES: YybH family protein [Niastella]|uniref:Nuclear transport factor 2 family protein n=1 Tax=Niastella soli TaxID=2821487 RepID=A0ABS3Z3S7_9BACT|nr:nuclear transport factor 2 family protein [Niastella soli]MBO9204295.1 nuclear transport factor 2 family protein [Niastella soli]